jgi:diacylglycerol kinase family enzyme
MHIGIQWRLLAVAAMLVFGLLLAASAVLIAHNIGLILIIGPVLAWMLIYAVWLVLVGSGGRKLRGYALLGFGTAVSVAWLGVLVSDANHRRLLMAIVGLLLAYVGIVLLLRKKYWQEKRRIGTESSIAAHFANPYLIINPKSGNGRATKAGIAELARERGITVLTTQKNGPDVESLARLAVQQGADMLGISGGDGSIGAAAKVALEYQLPLVVLPGGTRCHFARDLGLNPKRITDAMASFNGTIRQIDVGDINGRIFLNNVSFGVYADIVNHPEYRDNKLAVSRQVLNEVVEGKRQPYNLQFDNAENGQHFDQAVMVIVSANRYKTVGLLELGQRQHLDEGILQVNAVTRLNNALVRGLVKHASLHRLLKKPQKLKPAAEGASRQREVSGLDQWTAESFSIDSGEQSLVVGVDGEKERYETPVRVRIRPSALQVCVPLEGERSRPHSAFGGFMLRSMWRMALHGTPE